ncbi:MAG: nucleoside kinase [Oscillospiraceae bacterium]|nr:nucleoside kinase [Oscillospiraceae bacterium]
MIKVSFKDRIIKAPNGITVQELLSNEIEKVHALGCFCNNEICTLNYKIKKDVTIELINYEHVEGKKIYNRGIIYIMAKALEEMIPDALLNIKYEMNGAIFCDFVNMESTDELLKLLKERMLEITRKNLPIEIKKMSLVEAEKFYKKEHTFKGRVQLNSKLKEGVTLYFCDGYYNYLYGVMPISTGVIKTYDIQKYKSGFFVCYPDLDDINTIHKAQESKRLFNILAEYDDINRALGVNMLYKLNEKVRKHDIINYILLAEALHEKKIANIADEILKRKDVKMVLIAGPTSSGKTTFAKRLGLQLRLDGFELVTISVDNYFKERENTPKDEEGNYDFENIEAIDLELFNSHLQKLLAGEEIDVPTFDFTKGKKIFNGTKMRLKDDEILVIEGIHCLNDKLTKIIDKQKKFKIYISALAVLGIDFHNKISAIDTRLIRRIVRDYQFRGYSAKHTLEMWSSVRRGESKYIEPFVEDADMMFNSSLMYELGVLKDYALPLLEKIDNTLPEYSEAKRLITLLNFFESISKDEIPRVSLLREFIGGGFFGE